MSFETPQGPRATRILYLADSSIVLAVQAKVEIPKGPSNNSKPLEYVVTVSAREHVDGLTFDSSCVRAWIDDTELKCNDFKVVNRYFGNYTFKGFPVSLPPPDNFPWSVQKFAVPENVSTRDTLWISLAGHVFLDGKAVHVEDIPATLP